MRSHLANLAKDVVGFSEVAAGDVVVDIGANDGTLLQAYDLNGLCKIGFEPSNVAPTVLPDDTVYVRDYFSASTFEKVGEYPAKIVTSIAMFYDLENPQRFVGDIKGILHPQGMWVLELAYLPLILERTLFDGIVHEHLVYYALGPLERLLGDHKLAAVKAELNEINGGSIRLYICHDGHVPASMSTPDHTLRELRRNEFELALESAAPYEAFRESVEKVRTDLIGLLTRLKGDGKRVFGYGASTKGNTILQYCGIDESLVECIADRNPAKWGTATIGTGIPIVSEDEARKQDPDYFLILPWHFLDEFKLREAAFLARGGRFIVPLPEVSIFDASRHERI